jgi:PAS domain S-box-containing protein
MKAENLLNELPVHYYIIDLPTKTILQTNDPMISSGTEPCHQQLFNETEPCMIRNSKCFCEQAVNTENSEDLILETGTKPNKRYYKGKIKTLEESKIIVSFIDNTSERIAAKELKINNIRLNRAENLAGFGSWEIDLKAGLMLASKGACAIYGIDKLKMPLDAAKKIPLPEYREALDKEMEGLISGSKKYNISFRIKRPCDGEIRCVQSVAEYREDKHMVFGVIKDITEMTYYENALRESVADLSMAQDIARIGNWKFDPLTRSLSVSDQVNHILGSFETPFKPGIESFEKITGKEHFQLFKKVVFRAVINGRPFENQFKIKLPEGVEKWIEIICRPDSEKGPAGHFLRGTVQDITSTKKVENELQISNNLFRTLIQNLPDAIYMKDTGGRKIIANEGDAINCGLENAAQVIGKTDYEIYPKEVAEQYTYDDRQVMERGIAVVNREELLPGSPNRWILTTKVPLKDENGMITGLVGIGHDITLRKKMEEELKSSKLKAEESDRLKSVFLANMSHEIRTPLNGILGFSNLICSGEAESDQLDDFANFIDTSGQRLTAVIDNIIDISLIQSNQLKLEYSRFNLLEMLEELYTYFKVQKKEQLTAVDFRLTNYNTYGLTTFHSDKNRITQILKNLLDNAFKFTKQGSITFGLLESVHGELNLYVQDSGIGIEGSKLELIFENFRQVEEGFTRQYEGAGLGLPIVSGIVKRLRGKIRVESKPQQGSTFYITVPGYKDQDVAFTVPVIPGRSQKEPLEKINSGKLIVSFEDDRASIEYMKSVADLLGCRIINFENPLKGIEYLRRHKADLIFMDIRLPEMSGFEATQLIKQEFPNLPVIIQTAYTMKDDREKAFMAGCDDYLTKPVPLNDLRGRIKHYIGENN